MKVLIGSDEMPRRTFTMRLIWEPRELWLGLFWNRVSRPNPPGDFLIVYICALPCLPLALIWKLRS